MKIYSLLILYFSLYVSSLYVSPLYHSFVYIEAVGNITLPMRNCSYFPPKSNKPLLKCYIDNSDIIQLKSYNNFLGIKLYSQQPDIYKPLLNNDRFSTTFIGPQIRYIFIDNYSNYSIFRSLGYQPPIDNNTLEIIFILGYQFS